MFGINGLQFVLWVRFVPNANLWYKDMRPPSFAVLFNLFNFLSGKNRCTSGSETLQCASEWLGLILLVILSILLLYATSNTKKEIYSLRRSLRKSYTLRWWYWNKQSRKLLAWCARVLIVAVGQIPLPKRKSAQGCAIIMVFADPTSVKDFYKEQLLQLLRRTWIDCEDIISGGMCMRIISQYNTGINIVEPTVALYHHYRDNNNTRWQ